MAKKVKKIEEEKSDAPFDLIKALEGVEPYFRDGLHKLIYNLKIDIKSQKEFDKLLEDYGGFKIGEY